MTDELILTLKENINRIDMLNPSRSALLVQNTIFDFVHQILNNFIDDKDVKKYVECLEIFKEYVADKLFFTSMGMVLIYHKKDFPHFSKLFSLLESVFGKGCLKGLKPIIDAINFVNTDDTDILEKLHPEHRELVIRIIKYISPKTNIPNSVMDSL